MQKIIPAFMQINVRFPNWRKERICPALHRWWMAGTQSESCYLSHLLNTRRILLFEFHQNLWQTSFMPDKVRVNYYCSCHDDRRGLKKSRGMDKYKYIQRIGWIQEVGLSWQKRIERTNLGRWRPSYPHGHGICLLWNRDDDDTNGDDDDCVV